MKFEIVGMDPNSHHLKELRQLLQQCNFHFDNDDSSFHVVDDVDVDDDGLFVVDDVDDDLRSV